jgi:hypothetical protein
MYGRVYKFTAILNSEVKNTKIESMPVYDDSLVLVGAFSYLDNKRVCGFLAGSGYPLALSVSLGDTFFFTPVADLKSNITSAIISDSKLTDYSVKIKHTEEQL